MPRRRAYWQNTFLKWKLIYQEHPYLFSLILKAALCCINRGLNNMFFIGRHKVLIMQTDDNRITQNSWIASPSRRIPSSPQTESSGAGNTLCGRACTLQHPAAPYSPLLTLQLAQGASQVPMDSGIRHRCPCQPLTTLTWLNKAHGLHSCSGWWLCHRVPHHETCVAASWFGQSQILCLLGRGRTRHP